MRMNDLDMQKRDGKVFGDLLNACGEVYGQPVTDAQIKIWWAALHQYSIEQFTAALEHIVKTSKFMPKPAEIIEAIDGTIEEKSTNAWVKVVEALKKYGVYHSVAFDDPLIPAVIGAMGGWQQLCMGRSNDLPFRAKEFGQIYQVFKKNPPSYLPKYVVGHHEMAADSGKAKFDRKQVKLIGNRNEAWNLLQQEDMKQLPSPRTEPKLKD